MTRSVRLATPADDSAIRRLLRETPMRGAISVGFEREPDYFRGANLAGGTDQAIVAFDADRLVCAGRCTHRTCWVNGREARVGYLAELRLADAARGRFAILRDGYRFFHEQRPAQPAELHFTSIVADNERARRLLERGARGLPEYGFLAELETVLIAVPRHPREPKLRVASGSQEHLSAILRILNEHGCRRHLGAVWSAEMLPARELPLERFLVAFDGDEVVACGALWDQRAFRQTVIHGYASPLAFARPLVNFASALFGTARIPPPGSVLAQAFISPLGFTRGAEEILPDFLAAFFPAASRVGIEFLTLALPAGDSRLPVLRRRFSTRAYRSRLYRVDWPGDPRLALDSGVAEFLPDVALL